MHDWRYATPGVSHGPPSNMQPMPRRSAVASLADRVRRCAPRFLSAGRDTGSARADRVGTAAPADQRHRNHARGRGSRDPGHLGSSPGGTGRPTPEPVGARNWPMKGASILSSGRSRRWSSFCWAGSAGSARINWIRGSRSRRMASRSRSTSSHSIGNGCSSIPIRVLPPSISWSSRQEHRSTFV